MLKVHNAQMTELTMFTIAKVHKVNVKTMCTKCNCTLHNAQGMQMSFYNYCYWAQCVMCNSQRAFPEVISTKCYLSYQVFIIHHSLDFKCSLFICTIKTLVQFEYLLTDDTDTHTPLCIGDLDLNSVLMASGNSLLKWNNKPRKAHTLPITLHKLSH